MVKKRVTTRTITLKTESGSFSSIFNRFTGQKQNQNPDISLLRSLLSHEKAKILHVLKTKQPNSIYELAKIVGRDFKSVRADTRIMEEMGFIEMIPVHKGKRQKLKPLLVIDQLNIVLII